MTEYALFVPPESAVPDDGRDQTKKEARIYFDWLMSVRKERVRNLLNFLGETEVDDPQVDLPRIGEKVKEKLQQPEFSEYVVTSGEQTLTDRGYALAADMGLLVAELIQRYRPHIGWAVEKQKLITYNAPVLTGFPVMNPDPIRSGVARTLSVLDSSYQADGWWILFDKWMELTEETVPTEKTEIP